MNRLVLLPTLALFGCGGAQTPAPPTPRPWTHPTFEGDGLPASEGLEHQTYDSDPNAETPPPDGGGDELPTVDVHTALFAFTPVSTLIPFAGELTLLEKELGCGDLYGVSESFTPNGVYFTLVPTTTRGGNPDWTDTYTACGEEPQPPCFVRSFAVTGGEYLPLGDAAWVRVDSYSAHYLTVSWSTDASSGGGLTFYNCGAMSSWG